MSKYKDFKDLQIRILNSTFYEEDNKFEGLFPPVEDYPHLHKLLSEYYSLMKQSNISEQGAERISEILELAEYDKLLDECIDKIDQSLTIQSEVQSDSLSIEEFLIELKKLPNQESLNNDFMENFSELVQKVQINSELINNFIEFKDPKCNRQAILNYGRFCLYIICYQKGQQTSIHQNFTYSTMSMVYRGKATKTSYKRVFMNGVMTNQLLHEKIYKQGEWFSTDKDELHQLANVGSENLVTLHFKYFNVDPNEREIISEPITVNNSKIKVLEENKEDTSLTEESILFRNS